MKALTTTLNLIPQTQIVKSIPSHIEIHPLNLRASQPPLFQPSPLVVSRHGQDKHVLSLPSRSGRLCNNNRLCMYHMYVCT